MKIAEVSYAAKYGYKIGRHRPIDQCSAENIKKGRDAEKVAAKYLEDMGFREVTLGVGVGPDIVAVSPQGDVTKVEVKSSIKQGKGESWYVHTVCENRRYDDLIAIVTPCGSVFLEKMKDHLEKCPPNGRRTITEIVKGALVRAAEGRSA